MHKSLVALAAASTLLVMSSMAHADAPPTPTSPPATAVTAQANAATATAAPTNATNGTPVTTAEEAPPVAKRSVLPLVTIITGGAVFVTGLALLSFAGQQESQARTYDSVDSSLNGAGLSSTGYGKGAREDAASATSTGTALAVGGALVAAGGFVWFFIDGHRVKKQNAASLSVTPAMGPTTAGAYLQGTF